MKYASVVLSPIGILMCLLWAGSSFAGTELRSGPEQVTMLELYTSEGCSSCPPADRWLSNLVGRPGLWQQFVPLAFHVDYWDYIGWKDRFASAAYGKRQSRYRNEGGIRVVYTPGIIANGKEWRQWRTANEPGSTGSTAGLLAAHVDAGNASIRFSPSTITIESAVANIVLLGFGLKSDVQAGENRGRQLTNDFVVLGLGQIAMTKEDDGFSAVMPVPSSAVEADRRAVVVWISLPGRQMPLQAAGGWYRD